MDSTLQLDQWYNLAVKHRNEHNCSAYPYDEYSILHAYVSQLCPKRILEIGTGIGFTAAVMAAVDAGIHVDTIEKDLEHVASAKKFLRDISLDSRVDILSGIAEEILPQLSDQYDFIFFDGYQIHYEFLPHYERLLKTGGTLFLGNNHLNSKTSDHFFAELSDATKWEIVEKFSDTSVIKKK